MAFPVTLNGRTYTLTDFEGTNYVDGLPDAFEDFVTHAGDIYNSTSTTSNSIGTGSKTFTVESNKPYQAGTPLRIADAAAPSTNFLDTVVTSYSGTTLVVNSIGFGGSGTKTSWTVNIGGAKTVDGTLGLSQGGTGATDAAGARTNIDVYSKADADSRFLNVSGEASAVTISGNLSVDGGTIKLDGNYPVGTQNVALGDAALDDGSLSGGFNTAIGRASLSDNTSGSYNSALGNGSLQGNETGDANTAVGYNALTLNTASYNVAVGHQALEDNTSGNYLTAVGQAALGNNTSGIRNSALGRVALGSTTTGNYNSAFGYGALVANETHSNNTAMGYLALTDATANNNTAVGFESAKLTTTGHSNSALGFRSLHKNLTGNFNSAFGYEALYESSSASNNTAVGYQAGYSNTTGEYNTFVGKSAGYSSNVAAGRNTFVGMNSGYYVSSGDSNTILGRYNGNQGGLDIRTSNNNIVLSDGDGNPRLYFQTSNMHVIGMGAGSGTYTVKYNNSTGEVTKDTSSARYKDNIRDSNYGLSDVLQMQSRMFEYKKEGHTDVGFVAEELNEIIPELVAKDEENQPEAVSYDRLTSVLVKAIQEQQATITALQARIEALENV